MTFLGRMATTGSILVLVLGAILLERRDRSESAIPPEERECWIVLDVSRSMLSADENPDRLAAAKNVALEFLRRLSGRTIGIVAVAGEAKMLSPPTRDHEFLSQVLQKISIEAAPAGGSNWMKSLELISQRVRDDIATSILLLSDGGADTSGVAGWALKNKSMSVYPIGIGDPKVKSPIPLPGGEMLMESGNPVLSRLEEAPLRELARLSGGQYRRARELDDSELSAIARDLFSPRNRGSEESAVAIDPSPWLIAAALAVALFSTAREGLA